MPNSTTCSSVMSGGCSCGASSFSVEKTPFIRFYCHCEICQKLYNKPFSDVCVVKTKHVQIDDSNVNYNKYRSPPALQRGTCKQCHAPVAGFLRGYPGLAIAFISADNFNEKEALPAPSGHAFYHRRQKDIEDSLPKHEGYWSSQIAISKWVIPKLFQT